MQELIPKRFTIKVCVALACLFLTAEQKFLSTRLLQVPQTVPVGYELVEGDVQSYYFKNTQLEDLNSYILSLRERGYILTKFSLGENQNVIYNSELKIFQQLGSESEKQPVSGGLHFVAIQVKQILPVSYQDLPQSFNDSTLYNYSIPDTTIEGAGLSSASDQQFSAIELPSINEE